MSSYLLRKQLTITKLVSKRARGMNKQLPKTSGTDVLSSKKKLRKILWREGGIPTPFYVSGLNDSRKKPALIIVGKTDSQKEN